MKNLIIDRPGGADFEAHSLRNVASIHVGGASPAACALEVTGMLSTSDGLCVGNAAAGTTLGSVVKKIEVFDANGNSLGFIPVYDTIT